MCLHFSSTSTHNGGVLTASLFALRLCTDKQQGTPELQADVVARCKAAAPAHGEMWCSVSKKTENRRLDKEAILRKVVAQYFANSTATAAITALAAAAAAAGNSSAAQGSSG
jgi:hypothetical protein